MLNVILLICSLSEQQLAKVRGKRDVVQNEFWEYIQVVSQYSVVGVVRE